MKFHNKLLVLGVLFIGLWSCNTINQEVAPYVEMNNQTMDPPPDPDDGYPETESKVVLDSDEDVY
ncbi:hypothetical protein [Flammeovirga aprica]|uniref:Secreted protein n=1 Tax=Flammeovirga aprica JL-4 TaxID=694437 RepID=A0A7X9RYD1_9BACT|nr:hypothetical protein [Flammeovirga aprica]NME71010.1 hypothetical protein [Flammeovirga aprica JL-4]